ncbi:hypothetical protein AwPolaro_08240 [Polaromonas sp.]|nr:hypothetical protein AwPolaro_08240 [Polaromonas sp.]
MIHMDRRFSRGNFAEAVDETLDTPTAYDDDPSAMLEANTDPNEEADHSADAQESLAANCFDQLRWRARTFDADWPFTIDAHAQEIYLKEKLNPQHYLYLQLLLSSLLKYCPKTRRKTYTGSFEALSLQVLTALMPAGAEVHAFGAGHSTRYTGNLFARLQKLAADVRGDLRLTEKDFSKNDVGDAGLDLVAWHGLHDGRGHIPIALAQCGCTADGWPNKMLAASPAMLGKKLVVDHDWATYYFMPLDLTDERDGKILWQEPRYMSAVIVIDRLRLLRLADTIAPSKLQSARTIEAVDEALSLRMT